MTARTFEGQYAGFLTRAVGLLVDSVILLVAMFVYSLGIMLMFRSFGIELASCSGVPDSISAKALLCSSGRWFLVATLFLVSPLYHIIFWMLIGQTIGQRVMGVRVFRLDGHAMGFRHSLVRWIGRQLCMFTLGIGFLWVLVDDRRRGWHDLLARTCVLYSWEAVQKEGVIERLGRRMGRKRTSTG